MGTDDSLEITAHSSGISYQDLIASDRVPAPDVLKMVNPIDLPTTRVPVSQFTTREFHDLEMTRLWPKVLQRGRNSSGRRPYHL